MAMVGVRRRMAAAIVAALAMVAPFCAARAAPVGFASGETRLWWLDVVGQRVLHSVPVDQPGPIALSSGGTSESVPLPSVPTAVALSAADRFALLALGDRVAVVDVTGRRVAGTIELGEHVYDLAIDRACAGDCDRSGAVTVDDLVLGARIGMGTAGIDRCRSLDLDGNAELTVDELTTAVRNVLDGC